MDEQLRAEREAVSARREHERVRVGLPPGARRRRVERRQARAETGCANVSVSVLDGRRRTPVAGWATTWARAPGANHETRTGAASFSHGSAAAAIVVAPALIRPEARTPSGTTLRREGSLCTRPPIATRLTGRSKRTLTAAPRAGRSSVARTRAVGVTTVNVRCSCRPTSQPIQLGRWKSTVTVSFSPGTSRLPGQSVPSWRWAGTGFPFASTETSSA
jgi:hypothetical protein